MFCQPTTPITHVDKQEELIADQLHQLPPPVNGPFAVTVDGHVADVSIGHPPTGEVQMVARIREALEANRFDKAFGAGSVLGREEAVAAVRDYRGVARRTSLARPE